LKFLKEPFTSDNCATKELSGSKLPVIEYGILIEPPTQYKLELRAPVVIVCEYNSVVIKQKMTVKKVIKVFISTFFNR